MEDKWAEVQREYLKKQAPLRAAWLDESLSQEERDEAGEALRELVEETTRKCPPLTGTFSYTQEDVEEARRHGF